MSNDTSFLDQTLEAKEKSLKISLIAFQYSQY